MKLTAEANFYIDKFGPKAGIAYLKNLGYQNIIYTLTARILEPFLNKNSDDEFIKRFEDIRDAANEAGIHILFTMMREEIYNDQIPNVLNKNKAIYIQGIKATAILGCQHFGVRPVCFRCSIPNAWEESKKLTYEIYSELKDEADKYDVKLSFVNNTKQLCFTSGTYSYGCTGSELLELANKFGGGIIINPVYALKAGEKVEDILNIVKQSLIGFCIDDKSQRTTYQTFPMFGAVDYQSLIAFFEKYDSNAAIVMMYSYIFNRYTELASDSNIVDTVSRAFYKMACLFTETKANQAEEESI